jgi:predicted negative regulator of RcsB-dependent stress response
MKKKEKEHLKADPFVHFFETALTLFRENRRTILLAAGIIVLVVIALGALFLFQNLSSAGENRLYAEAFRVRIATDMTVDQKIARLQGMEFRRGISAAGRLFLAALEYEKGDLQKAEAILKVMPASRVALVNDQKQALYAQVLAAGGRTAEAEDALNRLLADKKTAMAKELILMQLADIEIKGKHADEAASTLKRILSEYPDTPSAIQARTRLSTLEGTGTIKQ